VSVNSSTSELVLNSVSALSGRARIVVRATDAGGLTVDSTITVDVNRANEAPQIQNYCIGSMGFGLFLVSGDVIDGDDDISNFIVDLWNVFEIRAAVDETGHFEFAIEIPNNTWGIEYAITRDPHGDVSDTHWDEILMT
jgi:hypothetical protein